MNWLITGGCGFIGSRLVGRLHAGGEHALRVLDDHSVGTLEDLARVVPCEADDAAQLSPPKPGGPVQVVRGDICEATDAQRAAEGMDVIVHLAANTGVIPSIEDPLADCRANVLGIVNVLEGARAHGVERFVFASSGAPLGEQTPPIHEQKVPRPVSPYGASKLAGEAYCSSYHASFGLATVALRFGNVYGPGSIHKGSVVARFIKQALDGETLVIYGDGRQTRDFIYIDDLVDALVLAADADAGGEVFQIASGGETTVNEIAEQLKRLLGERGVAVALEHEAARAGEVIRSFSDIGKARRVLGWAPTHSLEAGLEKTVDWFLQLVAGAGG
jgi:UDP-glucose 4-epimerase